MNIPWNRLNFSWDEFVPSSRYYDICNIIGEENIRDSKHVDSAFKSGCKCMFTCDSDIHSHSEELGKLLNIKFFHTDNNKEEFMAFLKRYEEKEIP